MKTINRIIFFLMVALSVASCKEDMEFGDNGVIPVSKLGTPEDATQLGLINTPEANTLFSWEGVNDQVTQSYYVAFFDKKSGGKELFRYAAEPQKTSVSISHDNLVTVALNAGIKPEQTGDVYWNVISYRGTSEVEASVARRQLSIKRYAAIDDIPLVLYLDGVNDKNTDGTMRKFTNCGSGLFEMYVKIEAGDKYLFTNNGGSGDRRVFTNIVSDGLGLLKEGTENESTALEAGIYRLRADFAKSRVTTQKVTNIELYHCAKGDVVQTKFSYAGNGVWKWDGDATGKKVIPTGDSRYRFLAVVDGVEEIWGSNNKDGGEEPAGFTGAFYNITIRPRATINQWDWAFKFISSTQGADVQSITLNMNGQQYSHAIDFGEITPAPVASITTPTALASTSVANPYKLSENASTSLSFAWTPAASAGAGIAPKYNVVFFKKAADGTFTELSRVSGLTTTTTAISATKLDEMASTAGAKSGEVNTIYWNVETQIINSKVFPEFEHKAFTVQRFIVPENLYITGAASEFGTTLASARKLTVVGNIGSGKFKLYTKLTAGTYNFVSATTGDPMKYTITDGKLVLGSTGITAVAGIYRITADVVAQTLVLEAVTGVKIDWTNNGNFSADLEYVKDGNWKTPTSYLASRVGWWGDRYNFKAKLDEVAESWGYFRKNNDGPETYHYTATDATNDNLPSQYIYEHATTDQWEYTFKDGRGAGGVTEHNVTKLEIFMNGDATDAHPHYHVTGTWVGAGTANDAISTHFVTMTK